MTSMASEPKVSDYRPAAGFVPDAATAIRIAVAVWEPIYGVELIATEKPYHAELHQGVWLVEGTLPAQYEDGGVATAKISKRTGEIIRVYHTK
jgi:hypothetical protein